MFRLASRYVVAIVRDTVCVSDRVCSGSVSRLPGTAAAFSRGNPLSQLGNDLHHTRAPQTTIWQTLLAVLNPIILYK